MGKSRFFVFSVSVFMALLIIIVGCAKKDPVLVRIDGKAQISDPVADEYEWIWIADDECP